MLLAMHIWEDSDIFLSWTSWTFLQRPLAYACWSASTVTYGGVDWARNSLVDHSKRFTKMYTPMCLIFPLHQGCEIYGSRGKSSLLLSLSLFWQKKLGWNTATNWLQTVCNCFCETMAELSPYKRPPGLRSLKYLPYTLYRKSLPTTLLYPCK